MHKSVKSSPHIWQIMFVLGVLFITSACKSGNRVQTTSVNDFSPSTQVPVPTQLPTPQTVVAGSAGIRGIILNFNGAIPPGTVVYFTQVSRHPEEGWAIFILDTATTRSTPVNEFGFFEEPNLPPGEYVLVVGNDPENAQAILGDDGQARVYKLTANEMLDIGTEGLSLIYVESTPEGLPAYPAPNNVDDAYPSQ